MSPCFAHLGRFWQPRSVALLLLLHKLHSLSFWSKIVIEFGTSPAAAAGGLEPEAVEKYAAKYSASVDPFAAWRAKAAEKRRASMGVHDR